MQMQIEILLQMFKDIVSKWMIEWLTGSLTKQIYVAALTAAVVCCCFMQNIYQM